MRESTVVKLGKQVDTKLSLTNSRHARQTTIYVNLYACLSFVVVLRELWPACLQEI